VVLAKQEGDWPMCNSTSVFKKMLLCNTTASIINLSWIVWASFATRPQPVQQKNKVSRPFV
jgi:hypothetical protein